MRRAPTHRWRGGRVAKGGGLLMRGHTKLESTVRYLGIEVDNALSISEQIEL